jgi:hypothetical protein
MIVSVFVIKMRESDWKLGGRYSIEVVEIDASFIYQGLGLWLDE